jgi:type IX secretion system PorP/SprF family membrane protein
MKQTEYKFGMRKWTSFFAVALVAGITSLTAQDVHFSQFTMSPLTQNPGLTGAIYDIQAIMNYRTQWASVASPYTTMAASFDMRLGHKKSRKGFWAAGMNIYDDKAGDAQLSILQANLNVAYHVRLNEYNILGAGIQAGFVQRSISAGALQWGNQYNGSVYDANLPTGETAGIAASKMFIDAGAGVVWSYDNTKGAKNVTDNHEFKINVGASVFHPQESSYSFYGDGEKLYMKFLVHSDARISIPNSNMAIVPAMMYSRQGNVQELDAGAMLRYKLKQDSKYTGFAKGAALSLGGYYRAGDAFAPAMLLEYANYALGMSYDLNTSPLRTASNLRGGVEITLRFVTPNPFLKRGSSSILYQPTP